MDHPARDVHIGHIAAVAMLPAVVIAPSVPGLAYAKHKDTNRKDRPWVGRYKLDAAVCVDVCSQQKLQNEMPGRLIVELQYHQDLAACCRLLCPGVQDYVCF